MLQPKIYIKKKKKIYDVEEIHFDINTAAYYNWKNPECVEHVDFSEVEFMANTGFKDKNGKYMFEKDIVEYRNSFFKEAIRGVVNSNKKIVSNNVIINLEEYEGNGLEVIGNIYENKELLEDI
nr:MAG TPA: YopX protein [Caudoviricetes sp.]